MEQSNNSRISMWKWIGFASSLIAAMQSGIFHSFAVYAVPLKEQFGLNLTKVELVGVFSVAGLSCMLVGHILIKKFGYIMVYITSWALVASSGVLMWMATMYVEFFNEQILLLCIFQMINSMGAALVELCCISVGVLQFEERHIGKITGLYLALVSLGKVYYAACYSIFFRDSEHLGMFFLFIPIGLTITLAPCVIFHRPSTKGDAGDNAINDTSVDYESIEKAELSFSLKDILTSKFFHTFFWTNVFFVGAGFSLMNNLTSIAKAAGMENEEYIIYIVTSGAVLSRVIFGVLLDSIHSKVGKIGLLIVCYATFTIAMLIGLLLLNVVTMHVLTVLASIGVGAGFSLIVSILSIVFGREHYSIIIGLQELGIFLFTTILSLAIGMLYDVEFEKLQVATAFCKDCFYWAFVILLCAGTFNLITSPITVRVWKAESKDSNDEREGLIIHGCC